MIASALLIIVAALAKAVMDSSSEAALQWQPADYWLKDKSWVRKWKYADGVVVGERFPCSSTIFVSLTDGWHLAQAVFLACIFALPFTWEAITHYKLLDFIIARVLFGLAFEYAFYRPLKG